MSMRPFQRFALVLVTAISINTAGVNRRAYAEEQSWCGFICGLGAVGCCLAAPVLCQGCILTGTGCYEWCKANF